MTSVDLNQTFVVEAGQVLVRRVIPRRGQPYEHACPLASFEQVAHAAEELGADGFTLDSLVEYEHKAGRYVPHTCSANAGSSMCSAAATSPPTGCIWTRWSSSTRWPKRRPS